MSDIEISQLGTGLVNGDIEYPATNPNDTTEANTGTTYKYIMSDMLNYNLTSQGFVTYSSCRVATINPLTAVYNNGTLGVGATLTNSGIQAALSIDGVTLKINDRVLIKDQAATFENGIYVVTDTGSATSNWQITRSTDFNSTAKIVYLGSVLIAQGATNAGKYFQETSATPIVVGTNPITFNLFFNPCVYLNNVTGSGKFVGSVSPTISNPILNNIKSTGASTIVVPNLNGTMAVSGANQNVSFNQMNLAQINDVNGNTSMTFYPVPSAVNYISCINNITGSRPYFAAIGSDTNIGLQLNTKGTGQLVIGTESLTQPFIIASGTSKQHTTVFQMSNTAATRTVTFQDSSGTLAYLSDIGIKAWVNFDGTTAPPTIKASSNVASVTKAGTGQYTITYTTPMANTNYAVTLGYGPSSNAGHLVSHTITYSNKLVGSVDLNSTAGDNAIYNFISVDCADVSLVVYNT